MPTLTTADLQSFAAASLAAIRKRADAYHAHALACRGQTEAHTRSRYIDILADDADQTLGLAACASAHGDHAAADCINADWKATRDRLNAQALAARLASIPHVEASA